MSKALETIRDSFFGVAHDAADANAPVKIGHKAVSHGSSPSEVAANDRTDWYSNRQGIPFVMAGHPNIETLQQTNTGAQTDQVLKTVNANEKFVITCIVLHNANDSTVDVDATIEFGTNTNFVYDAIAPGSTIVIGDGSGMLGVGAAAEDVLLTNSVPTTGSFNVNVIGYLITEA